MPLSEHEQRVLEQMERQLASDDPKLASTLATASPRRSGRVILGILAILAGLALLVSGVAASILILSVVGFLAMLGGTLVVISKPKANKSAGPHSNVQPTGKSKKSSKRGRQPFMTRMEERWDKRRRNGEL